MSQDDWYRNTTWTKDVQEAFFTRLKRSRGNFHKAQYLCIQAGYLYKTCKKEYIFEALRLLDTFFAECPESFCLSLAYLQQSQCYEFLGNNESAISSFRESIKAQEAHPNLRTLGGLYFALFVVKHSFTEYYEEALSSIGIQEANLLFPDIEFKYYSVLAIIYEYQRKIEEAKQCANLALKAMNKTEIIFQYHKKVGLVKNPDPRIIDKLKNIVQKSD